VRRFEVRGFSRGSKPISIVLGGNSSRTQLLVKIRHLEIYNVFIYLYCIKKAPDCSGAFLVQKTLVL
jgi:hypothetical protein